jgi:hypothetical protein
MKVFEHVYFIGDRVFFQPKTTKNSLHGKTAAWKLGTAVNVTSRLVQIKRGTQTFKVHCSAVRAPKIKSNQLESEPSSSVPSSSFRRKNSSKRPHLDLSILNQQQTEQLEEEEEWDHEVEKALIQTRSSLLIKQRKNFACSAGILSKSVNPQKRLTVARKSKRDITSEFLERRAPVSKLPLIRPEPPTGRAKSHQIIKDIDAWPGTT